MKETSNTYLTNISALYELEQRLQTPVLVFSSSSLTIHVVPIFYECLRRMGRVDKLSLVLYSRGGEVVTARRVAQILREFTTELQIIVPHACESAGTLLCLASDRIIAGAMANFSPIDAHLVLRSRTGEVNSLVSSHAIRALPRMLESWFGIQAEDYRFQAFVALCQEYSPEVLLAAFRADAEVRQLATELIAYHLSDRDEAERMRVTTQLIDGYSSHSFQITRSDLRRLGLKVEYPDDTLEAVLWSMTQECRKHIQTLDQDTIVSGLLFSRIFAARCIEPHLNPVPTSDSIPNRIFAEWEIVSC